MKKILTSIIITVFVFTKMNAQQQYQISQYMFSQMAYNPAYAGSQDMIELDALNRQQWVGFPGAPITTLFNVNAPVKPFRTQGGVGLSIVQDKVAITNQLSFAATYAYRFNIGNGKLAFGARLGFMNYKANFASLKPAENSLNNALSATGGNAFPDIDVGAYYNSEKTYFGISSVHISSPKLKYKQGDGIDFTISRAFTATAGYKYLFSNPLFELHPSVLVMSDLKVTYADFTGVLYYNKRIWGGLTYRSGNSIFGNAFVILVGLELKNGLRFGYSYDVVTSSIWSYSAGSHEITLRYAFKIKTDKIPQKYKSIRFL